MYSRTRYVFYTVVLFGWTSRVFFACLVDAPFCRFNAATPRDSKVSFFVMSCRVVSYRVVCADCSREFIGPTTINSTDCRGSGFAGKPMKVVGVLGSKGSGK